MTVKPYLGLQVVMPCHIPTSRARYFIENKKTWISQQYLQAKRKEQLISRLPPLPIDEAKNHLRQRLLELSRKFQLKFNRLSIRQQRTRWGSCSLKGNINLNLRVYYLPEELQDYVLLHELAHTIHHNHSPAFWSLMDKLTDDARRLNKRLKEFDYLLYRPPGNDY